jgi:hypothetical protein
VRQDGRQDRLQVVHHAQDDVHAGRRRDPVLFDLEPGRLAVEVAVGLAGQRQRLAQRRPELAGVVQLAHRLEAGLDLLQQRPVLVIQFARLGHLAIEALVGKRQHEPECLPRALAQVPPRRHQLVVVPLDKILPRELGLARLGGGRGQVKAQRIGIVLAEKVEHLHEGAAALAELSAAEVEVFSDTGCKDVIRLLHPTMHLFLT